MPFSGIDDIVSEMGAGKRMRLNFTRTIDTGATTSAGRWHSCMTTGGTGGAMTLTGTAGTGIALNSSTVGALPLNAAVSPDTRHILSLYGMTPQALLVPATLMLVDLIHVYPSCVLTGTPSTMSNHPTWTGTGDTRMTAANDVMVGILTTTATTAGNGQITITYLDQGGNSGTAGALYAPSTTTPSGCFWGAANAAVTLGAPFATLAAGDLGVQRVSSYAINTGATTGVGAFLLYRPICEIPLAVANTPGERSFLNDVTTLPRVYDDSCLAFIVNVGGALTASQTLTGNMVMAWG
jgi:hypothetical protein